MPTALTVIALQSSNSRKIDLHSKERNNYRQTIITCQWIELQNYHHVCHEQVLGKVFLYSFFFTVYMGKIHKENLIAYYCFDMTDKHPYVMKQKIFKVFLRPLQLNLLFLRPDFSAGNNLVNHAITFQRAIMPQKNCKFTCKGSISNRLTI